MEQQDPLSFSVADNLKIRLPETFECGHEVNTIFKEQTAQTNCPPYIHKSARGDIDISLSSP